MNDKYGDSVLIDVKYNLEIQVTKRRYLFCIDVQSSQTSRDNKIPKIETLKWQSWPTISIALRV